MNTNMNTDWEVIACDNCHSVFAIPKVVADRLQDCHNSFYCPQGHSMSYQKKTAADKLRESFEYQRKRADELAIQVANRDKTIKRLSRRNRKAEVTR